MASRPRPPSPASTGSISKALADYRSGARPSIGVAAMTEAASQLGDDDIAALAAFLEAKH